MYHNHRNAAGQFAPRPTFTEKAQGTGYWTVYATLTAAYQRGQALHVEYRKRNGELSVRWVLLLGPVQTSLEGNHYVKVVDLDADGPRTLRLDGMRAGGVSPAGSMLDDTDDDLYTVNGVIPPWA